VIGRFIQADTVVPGGVQGLDRYAYSYNNPVKYIDPSGHKACHWGDPNKACSEYSDIEYQLDSQIEKPDKKCYAEITCYRSYLTFKALVLSLHYIPSAEEIIYMTAQAEGYSQKGNEYYGSGTYENNFIEAIARNYYQPYRACEIGSYTCTTSKLYKFMSGYQVWFDGTKSQTSRASNLIKQGVNNNSYRGDLEQQVENILDPRIASQEGWTQGIGLGDNSWQWHNWTRPPTEGEAIGWIYLVTDYGNYLWIMTYNQTQYFQDEIEK
jgi:hypothetical protein